MKSAPLIFGALVFLAVKATKKINAVSALKLSVEAIPSISTGSGGAIIGFPLGISNNTGEGYDVTKIYMEASLGSQYIGDASSDAPFRIASYGKSTVPITLRLNLTNAVASLISAITTKTGDRELTLTGTVVTHSITIPFTIKKNLF